MSGPERDVSHAVGDARKRLLEADETYNFDERHAHLDVPDWPEYDDH